MPVPDDKALVAELREWADYGSKIGKELRTLMRKSADRLAALSPSHPSEVADERAAIVAWLRAHECSMMIPDEWDLEPFDEAADAIERGDHLQVCRVPPAGWYCTRAPGHEGPIAALRSSPPADDGRMLNDLLAVIHRDGGHRQDEVGVEQAWMEAMMLVPSYLAAAEQPPADDGEKG